MENTMPRQARIQMPDLLYHVLFRGIERRSIFADKEDYQEFLGRLESAKEDALIFAWALMPNHGHLLLRTGRAPLADIMRRLLTGYAVYFNRRHKRVGHLFQNRYKSIVCDEDLYLKTLVAYVHLNPLKAGLTKDLETLAAYPWCGHGAMLGKIKAPWQAVDAALACFGETRVFALREYMKHIANQRKDPGNYDGGGLLRSTGGKGGVLALRRSGDHQRADERILGDGDFVTRVLGQEGKENKALSPLKASKAVEWLLENVCRYFGVKAPDLSGPSREANLAKAREACVYLGRTRLGLKGHVFAEQFKRTSGGVSRAYQRGRRWVEEERDLKRMFYGN